MYDKFVTGYARRIAEDPLRPKLTVDKQIEHMKSKGILFTIYDEEKAKEYLQTNTYYFKIKAYEKLFDKYNLPEKSDQYIGLEFAYLCDLATIDCYLRKEIINISLDIEHYLKVRLLQDFNLSDENGYTIVRDFLETNPDHYEYEINSKMSGKACSNLVKKYADRWAIWNFVEILSFGDFAEFFKYFYLRNEQFGKSEKLSYLINPVRLLRNAAAHNNCLLHTLKVPYVTTDKFNRNMVVSAFLGQHGIKNRTLNNCMERPLLHDFCVMLYLYHKIAPTNVQVHTFKRLKERLENRVAKHGEYYCNNGILISSYEFVLNTVNVFLSLAEK